MTTAVQRDSNGDVGDCAIDQLDIGAGAGAAGLVALGALVTLREITQTRSSHTGTVIAANIVAADARVAGITNATQLGARKVSKHTRQLTRRACVASIALTQLCGAVADAM